MSQDKLRTYGVKKELEYATGDMFETDVQFILALENHNYIGTRMKKDDGVDGLIIKRESNNKKSVVLYSIYGPEQSTRWNIKMRKIENDLSEMIKHAAKYDESMFKFIFNFKIGFEQAEAFESLMHKNEIKYELYDPEKLITLLKTDSQIRSAVAFIVGIEGEDRPLTDFNNHVFAGEVLKVLQSFDLKEDLSDKMTKINDMKLQVMSYLSNEHMRIGPRFFSFKQESNVQLYLVPDRKQLVEKTQVNSGLETAYLVHDKKKEIQRLSKEDFQMLHDGLWEEELTVLSPYKGCLAVKVENLLVVYQILENCLSCLENSGDMDLYQVLLRMYRNQKKSILEREVSRNFRNKELS
ncbi:hypothetical protein EVJ29_13105 [Exiguobacterium sp. SH4S7]|uniref:hypothetical protein n=1 Tax=Exiguobacterium sp. SH4S7 TaxID=2510958 RepID=UPI0010409730|nr:hypothetical protein [Exiguobacterium sp. SH4S7]TCI33822.1 hypothetical protein EVJ29_13105 [Exiguobacterium sp. SH4S7]